MPADEPVVIDWESAYQEKLSLLSSEYNFGNDKNVNAMYDLVDIDGNGIPELVVSEGTAHASLCYVYVYSDGSYIETSFSDGKTGFAENGYMGVDTERHIARSAYYGHGYQFADFYRLEGTEFVNIASFENGFDNGETTGIYNGQTVSQTEYETYRAEYGTDYEAYGRTYTY